MKSYHVFFPPGQPGLVFNGDRGPSNVPVGRVTFARIHGQAFAVVYLDNSPDPDPAAVAVDPLDTARFTFETGSRHGPPAVDVRRWPDGVAFGGGIGLGATYVVPFTFPGTTVAVAGSP